jgi:hypothetical protein
VGYGGGGGGYGCWVSVGKVGKGPGPPVLGRVEGVAGFVGGNVAGGKV